jgi:hypothetical protein
MYKIASYLELYSGTFNTKYNMIQKYLILNKKNGWSGEEECKQHSEFHFQNQK